MLKHSDNIKLEIINNAIKVFSKRGYGVASIADVAKLAAISQVSIYEHYSSKQALFTASIKSIAGQPWKLNVPVDKITTPEYFYKALYIIAKGLNEIFAQPEYVQLLRIVISEVDKEPELEGLLDVGITKQAMVELIKLFESANKNNVISVRDPNVSARRFVGGFLTNVYLDGLLVPAPSRVQKYTPKQLFDYVSTYMPHLVTKIITKDRTASSAV